MANSPRYQGYTSPPYKVTLQDDNGAAINLTGLTGSAFSLYLENAATGVNTKCTGVWTVLDAANGKAQYQWTAADLATAGVFYAGVSVQLAGEPGVRAFDPDIIIVDAFPGGLLMTTQDVNLLQVNGATVSPSNPVPVAGPVTTIDGGNVAQGTTTDSASANTVIGLLKSAKANTAAGAQEAGGHLAAVDTSNAAISAATGTQADTAYTGTGAASLVSILKGIFAQVKTTATPRALIASWGSNPTQTAASAADTQFKFGGAGTTPVLAILLQNNSGSTISYGLDATSVNTFTLVTGQTAYIDTGAPISILHLSSAAQQYINHASNVGITVQAWG